MIYEQENFKRQDNVWYRKTKGLEGLYLEEVRKLAKLISTS